MFEAGQDEIDNMKCENEQQKQQSIYRPTV